MINGSVFSFGTAIPDAPGYPVFGLLDRNVWRVLDIALRKSLVRDFGDFFERSQSLNLSVYRTLDCYGLFRPELWPV